MGSAGGNGRPGPALVIGASGLVGGALLRALERRGIPAVGTHQSQPTAATQALDIRDASAVRACVQALHPRWVFLAVNTPGGVDFCEEHPAEAQALNVTATEHVARAAAEAGALLIYYCTDYIFDGRSGPYTEEAAAAPVNVYGRTKWEAEQRIRALGAPHLIIRTTAVFGWDLRSRNFAMQIWEQLRQGRALRVPADQWGNPTLADDLAEASLQLLDRGATGTVNVVGKERMPRAELGRALASRMGLDAALVVPVLTAELGQRAPRPLQGGLTTEKLERLLGAPAPALAHALERFAQRWRQDASPVTAGAADEAEQLRADIRDRVRRYTALKHAPKLFEPGRSRVPYAGRVFDAEEVTRLVDSSLDFWLTLGPYGNECERQLRQYYGAQDALLVNAGSSANLLMVATLCAPELDRLLRPEDPPRLRPGDEVITPAVTFPTTLTPLLQHQLVPVFVDCEIGTYNINPALIAAAVGPRTRAILIPHTLGNPCDMAAIMAVAKQHHLWVLEDSCDALGAQFDGQLAGTFGAMTSLSFYPAHHITMGEGGAVVINHPRLRKTARSIRDWGRDCWCDPGQSDTCGKRFGWQLGDLPEGYDHKYIYSNIGYNLKPTDLQAAIGVAQLAKAPAFIAARRRNFQRLYEGLQPLQQWVELPKHDPRAHPSPFGFPITVREGVERRALIRWLEDANIETRLVFAGNILRQPAFRDIPHRVAGTLEMSDRVMRDTFFVGVYPGLTTAMVEYMIERITAFFQRSA